MGSIFNKSGGYRKLYPFNFATIVHLGIIGFVRRFVDWKDDPLGKLAGQMVGASRSGKQNIVEGSKRAKTSTETEIKLTDVAKGSLAELLGDLEGFLACRNSIPWSIHSEDYRAVNGITLEPFEYTDDTLHDYWTHLHREKSKFDPWLEHADATVVANALIARHRLQRSRPPPYPLARTVVRSARQSRRYARKPPRLQRPALTRVVAVEQLRLDGYDSQQAVLTVQ